MIPKHRCHFQSKCAVAYAAIFEEMVALSQELGFRVRIMQKRNL